MREHTGWRQDADDAEIWTRAASDPQLMREAQDLEAEFRSADRETWPE